MTTRVVVDAMGSDRHPSVEIAGALRVVREASDIAVTLVGDRSRLEVDHPQIDVVHASEIVSMHDHPAQAFRAKPDSSLRVAMQQLADGHADAIVSAGNSGAAFACAVFVLGRSPGIERPAIVTTLPTPSGPVVLCDAGANVDPKPAMLAQFGRIGCAYDRVVHGRPRPRLGILANGGEREKGTELTRAAFEILAAQTDESFTFIGYVEGSDLFRGVVDVIATDGFTGNVVLKTCEGIAEGMFGMMTTSLQRLGSALVAPALRDLAKKIDYTEVGGALLAGVTKPVVIAHGRSDDVAMANAIRAAARFAIADLPNRL